MVLALPDILLDDLDDIVDEKDGTTACPLCPRPRCIEKAEVRCWGTPYRNMELGMHTRAKPVKRKGKEIEEVKESKRKKDKVVATPAHIDHCGAIGHNSMGSFTIWLMIAVQDKQKAEDL
ncbi:hypothetical protein BGZ46_000420 [Entomortierella lignicola]|nr:hypothetical protein BGZ46_000420 [Entomortierella lignicola]